MSLLELSIVAFIIVGIGYVVWKGGAANPEGTGALGQKVTTLSVHMTKLSGRVGHVESELEELKADAATSKDIARLEEKVATLRAEVGGHRELAERTWRSVNRIETFLIEKGLGK